MVAVRDPAALARKQKAKRTKADRKSKKKREKQMKRARVASMIECRGCLEPAVKRNCCGGVRRLVVWMLGLRAARGGRGGVWGNGSS
jgi:hypothetical protein